MTVTGLGDGETGLESLLVSLTDPPWLKSVPSLLVIESIGWLARRGLR